jgi:hypothetical protein
VEVCCVADVLERYAASIIRVKVNRRGELSCYISWQPNRPMERGLVSVLGQ